MKYEKKKLINDIKRLYDLLKFNKFSFGIECDKNEVENAFFNNNINYMKGCIGRYFNFNEKSTELLINGLKEHFNISYNNLVKHIFVFYYVHILRQLNIDVQQNIVLTKLNKLFKKYEESYNPFIMDELNMDEFKDDIKVVKNSLAPTRIKGDDFEKRMDRISKRLGLNDTNIINELNGTEFRELFDDSHVYRTNFGKKHYLRKINKK